MNDQERICYKLNEAIATSIMGWKKIRIVSRSGNRWRWRDSDENWSTLPRYATDLNFAFAALEKWLKSHDQCIWRTAFTSGIYWCGIGGWESHMEAESTESLAVAICKAIIKANKETGDE